MNSSKLSKRMIDIKHQRTYQWHANTLIIVCLHDTGHECVVSVYYQYTILSVYAAQLEPSPEKVGGPVVPRSGQRWPHCLAPSILPSDLRLPVSPSVFKKHRTLHMWSLFGVTWNHDHRYYIYICPTRTGCCLLCRCRHPGRWCVGSALPPFPNWSKILAFLSFIKMSIHFLHSS